MSLYFKGIYLSGGGGGANLTALDVTPMTNYQSISPEEGYDGFSLVNVSAVNSSIDPNITASNIASGVNILGVTGSMVVPNGTIEITSNASWNVAQYEFANINVAGGRPAKYGITIDNLLPNESLSWPSSSYWGAPTDMYLANAHTLLYMAFANKFRNCHGINSFTTDAQNIGRLAFSNAFTGSSIVGANFYNVYNINTGDCFENAFAYCNSLKEITFSNLQNIYARTSGDAYCFNYAFINCSNLTTVNFPKLEIVSGEYSSSSLAPVGIFLRAFENCVNLMTVLFPSLRVVSSHYAFFGAFDGCTNLSYVEFPELQTITNATYAFNRTFANSGVKNIMFPALQNAGASNVFAGMLNNVTDCTVHFPQALESTMSSWDSVTNGFGGTNINVLFDL